MKILVATEKPFAEIAVTRIRRVIEEAGHQVQILENYKGYDEIISTVSDADALIVRSDLVTSAIIEAAKKLKIIVRAGAGYDNIDLKSSNEHGVIVMNTPGQNSNAVAELAYEMMLYHARSGFSGKSGSELRGKTIGIHAYGNVGRYMAEIAKGFGMHIFAYDPFVKKDVIEADGLKAAGSAEELYSVCRYISLHLPANDKTRNLVDYNLMNSMPRGAVLINTARKEIINEKDLLVIFEERPDFSYLSDVVPDCRSIIEEKYSGRFIFTAKKMGAQTEEANINAGVAAAVQVTEYFSTGNEKFRVNY